MIRAVLFCLCLASCGGSDPISMLITPAVAQSGLVPIAAPYTTTQSEFTQYRNAAIPITKGNNNYCASPGAAFTASSNILYVGGWKHVVLAHWVLAIVPNGGSARLVAFNPGPAELEIVAEWGGSQISPISAGAYVTAKINEFIDSGLQQKSLGLQICGPAQVYVSTVEVIYINDQPH